MSRPIRLEFPGALYHVTSRGNRSSNIYFDDTDRLIWLEVLADVCARYNFVVHGFCEMTNHFHLLVETIDGDLARGMRQLNSVYSQRINRRHGLVGHLLQGRYHAILVQKETYLLALARYIVLNPVRARMVTSADEWNWSSHAYSTGVYDKPEWLETDWLLGHFGPDRLRARQAYNQYIDDGRNMPSPLRDVRHQVLLGDQAFLDQHKHAVMSDDLSYASRAQRRVTAESLADYSRRYDRREECMARAFWSMAYSMKDIATYFKTSTRTVGRAVKKFEISLQDESKHLIALPPDPPSAKSPD